MTTSKASLTKQSKRLRQQIAKLWKQERAVNQKLADVSNEKVVGNCYLHTRDTGDAIYYTYSRVLGVNEEGLETLRFSSNLKEPNIRIDRVTIYSADFLKEKEYRKIDHIEFLAAWQDLLQQIHSKWDKDAW